MPKLKIAFFTDTYHPQVNGLVTSVATSRDELVKQGHQALVVAPHLAGELPEKDVYRLLGFPYYPQPEYTFVLPWGLGFNLRHFGRFDCDIIHSHAMFGAGLIALPLAALNKLPLVLTYHTLFEDYLHYVPLPLAFTRWFNRAYTRWMCHRCALIIAPTPAIQTVLQGYGVKTRIEVLPTGLNAEVFIKTGVKKSDYEVADDTLLLSCAGRTGREKKMDLLINALAKADKDLPKWKLLIAGDGPERANLQAQIDKLGLGAKVQILGYLPRAKVLDLMQASDLFAFPSVTETQGMVVIEAMGRGTPVLGADAMGVGYMMAFDSAKNGFAQAGPGEARGGWLAKPNDEADTTRLLIQILNDPAARAKKAEEASEMAKSYAAEAINAKLAGFYEEAVKK